MCLDYRHRELSEWLWDREIRTLVSCLRGLERRRAVCALRECGTSLAVARLSWAGDW